MPLIAGKGGRCIPNYFLDGASIYVANPRTFADINALARPERIRGIEVYRSSGSIPTEFDRVLFTGCGSIVIWTR